jgi:hypothetical protein
MNYIRSGFAVVLAVLFLAEGALAVPGQETSLTRGKALVPGQAQMPGDINQANDHFGAAVNTAGDVNNDGYDDVIIGAPYSDNGQTNEGNVNVFYGSSDSQGNEFWGMEIDQAEANFGSAVSTAGDVNNDGYDDVIIGAPFFDNGQTNEGRAYVYHGSASGLSETPAWTAEADQANASFGAAVSTAGDVNHDGYDDVIVGAPNFDNGQTNEGRAYVYYGSASGLGAAPARTVESDQAVAKYGYSVSTAGDVNADGYADVIIGAFDYDHGQVNEGGAFVYHGSASGLGSAPARIVESNQADSSFGVSVSTAGDVNGDGYADVIVGAHFYNNGQEDEGRAYVFHGSASGLGSAPAWVVDGKQEGALLGLSVSTAGDMNGDGFAEVVVGAPAWSHGQRREGCAFIYTGTPAGLNRWIARVLEHDQVDAWFGGAVGLAGDRDGDGYMDVIVGAPYYDFEELNEGVATTFFGSPMIGVTEVYLPSLIR